MYIFSRSFVVHFPFNISYLDVANLGLGELQMQAFVRLAQDFKCRSNNGCKPLFIGYESALVILIYPITVLSLSYHF